MVRPVQVDALGPALAPGPGKDKPPVLENGGAGGGLLAHHPAPEYHDGEAVAGCMWRLGLALAHHSVALGPPSLRPQIRRDYPLNLSISLSGGKETNKDSPSNGE